MKDEIKEILDIENYRNKDGYVENINLLPEEIHKLLDYITNLQEENEYSNHCNEELRKKITNLEYKIERQKEELNEQYKQRNKFKKKYSYLKVAKEDYKSKNEKAIYYIWKEIEQEYDEENNKWLKEKIDKLLNKLQGVDKE